MTRKLALQIALCFGIIIASHTANAADGKLDVYWIDVEGGAATLMVTPAGESILIDTGNPGFRDSDRIVRTARDAAKIRRIDHLIVTHYHLDHFGGAATLSSLMPIGNVYDNGVFEGMPDDPGKEYFGFKCEKRNVIHPGDRLSLKQTDGGPKISIRCLGCRQQFVSPDASAPQNSEICAAHQDKERDGSDNANSVVMLLEFGNFRFYDAGDLTWNQEQKLVCPVNLVGVVDVYQVTHHGLDSSNNPVVLRSLQPTVAVMNNGTEKGCLPEVFANLKETTSLAAIYQMHKNLRPDGSVNNVADEYIANLKAECDGNYVHMSVDQDAKRYTVSIPSNGHEKTYETKKK